VYSSHLTTWRRERDEGQLAGLTPKKRGRKSQHNPLADEYARLQREHAKLKHELFKANAVIEVQRKVAALLGEVLPAPTETRSARSWLLRRGARRDSEGPQLGAELGRVEASSGGEPVLGSQLEVAIAGPEREDPEHVAQVDLGVQTMEACGSDQGHEVAGGLCVVVAADEQPRLRPTAVLRSARSEALLSRRKRPSSKNRVSGARWRWA
jgi:hypothetical protein